jgi:hypothetical protein
MSYFLSFDCAVKTFAFSFIRLDFLNIDYRKLREQLSIVRDIIYILSNNIKVNNIDNVNKISTHFDEMIKIVTSIDNKIKHSIQVIDADTFDLLDGGKMSDSDMITRIKGLCEYVDKKINPMISIYPKDKITVLIEQQMPGTPAISIASGLATIFSPYYGYNTYMVCPSLKNKCNLSEQGEYHIFAKKYKKSYDANKAHTLQNLLFLESVFDFDINLSRNMKGHVADCVMQTLAFYVDSVLSNSRR